MPTIRVPPGVIRGESDAMVPGRFHAVNFLRWVQGRLTPIGGWERTTQTPLASIPRTSHVWFDTDGTRQQGIVCDAHIYRVTNNIYSNITPLGFNTALSTLARGYGSGLYGLADYGSDDEARGGPGAPTDVFARKPVKFSTSNWNDEFLFSTSADGRIWIWDPKTPSVAPVVAANAPGLIQDFIVTDEHHLMAFGASGKPNQVSWSDQGNREGWDFTDVTGQAGFFDLEGAGVIMSAVKVPGAILIFTTTSVWQGRYIGAPYYYAFNKIAEGCTPISPQAVGVAGPRAYWMGQRSFWKYEGGVVTPMPCSLGSTPFEKLDPQMARHRVTAGFNGAFPEIWFYYPERQDLVPGAVENNRFVIYNFDEDWWADGTQARSMFTSSPIDQIPIAAHPGGWMYQHETGFLDEGQPRLDRVWGEVGGISFDDGDSNYTVKQCQIDSPLGPESVQFKFRGKRTRGGAEADLGTYIPRPSGLLNTHFTARDFTMRIEGRVDGPWALGAFNFHNVSKRGPR